MAAVLPWALVGCATRPQACTLVGGTDAIAVQVGAAVQARAASFDVRLCQGGRCRDVRFGARPRPGSEMYVARGVTRTAARDGYVIDLDQALGGGWKPSPEATADVRAHGDDGTVVARKHETFRWRFDYPNGKDCDKEPYLHHTVTLA